MVARFKKKFTQFSAKVNWTEFLLVCVFSLSSWICSTSVWTELSIIVYEVDEGWRMPSVLTLIAQLGQITPALIYPWIKYKHPSIFKNSSVIYAKLVIEAGLLVLLLFIWKKTIRIANEDRSIGLYFVNFWFSLFDGMSVVSYLPFIQVHLQNEYIISNFIGESFASLIPSSVTFIQGVDDPQATCEQQQRIQQKNQSDFGVRVKPPVNFSVEFYFIIILVFFLVSASSFVLLNNLLKKKKKSRQSLSLLTRKSETISSEQAQFIEAPKEIQQIDTKKSPQNQTIEKVILLSSAFIICFFMFGVLLGLQSYSTLSYGHEAFHLSINLGNLLLPVAVFVSIWSYDISMTRFLIEFAIGLAFSAYIVVVSVYSPCPPLVTHWLGSWIVVTAWILAEAIFTRLRCILASKLEKFKSERLLLILGSVSLLGQITGGALIYLMVDIYRLFKHKPDCVFDFRYCN